MINPIDLSDKHIVVTGASSGIGRATCIQASKLGAKISLVARNKEKLDETLSLMDGTSHAVFAFDLTDIDQIKQLISEIVDKQGMIDGLVHCAGISVNRPIKLVKPDFVERMTIINYYSFVELIRTVSSKNRSNDNASYVGISSVASIRGEKAQGAYAGTKGAMNSIVHSFAKELSSRGIRVNTIAFGMVDTNMYQEFIESGGNSDDLLQNQILGVIPPEYAGNAICFLLSDISRFITGSTICYDAGFLA